MKPKLIRLNITSQVEGVYHLDDQTIIETPAFTLIVRKDESEVADIFCGQGFQTMQDIALSIGEPTFMEDNDETNDAG
jgi:hypothetical protein